MIVLRGGVLFCLMILSHFFQFFRRIEGIISKAIFYQLLCILAIAFLSLTLPIGSIVPSMLNTFIGFKTTPFQRIENIFFSSRYIAVLISILYSDQEIASM